MANRVQYTIGFNADASQAKKALQDLNTQLEKLKANAESDLGISSDLSEAAQAANLLQENLSKAFNQNTGKWNFSDLNKSLQSSGTSVTELSRKFLNCGATGQDAFLALNRAVATMEIPITKTTTMLDKMMVTLKNTVKWELSSTFVHGLESGLSGAINYAKDLNSSLNDIRIVTGYSADDMTKFAVQANKAAKQLSTTTKAYTDASLIYFQQGDTADMVAKKAAITTKAANVAFSASAEEMSEMLTAVWNSYQVGEEELEKYVDIMAALGAATATSTEEIATAMQKVAATANTVGVSMEQMSSIIATVASVTREAPESIGTSFKTILARMGDLKVGKTLEDGMSLGTVSSQLAAVGVNILNTTGELKDMGGVIEELMSKWQGMTSAEKTAVAQAVAGKRQYTQLMALMENQDMYQRSMNIAGSAEGTLQKQVDIYAESWEAASKRVKASLEGIYQNLIPEKGLISATKTMSKVLDVVNEMIKGFGGLSGIVVQVGSALATAFSSKIAASVTGMVTKVGQFVKSFNMTDQNGKSIGFKAKVKSLFSETTDQRKYKQSNVTIQSQISEALSNPAISNSTKEALTATDTLLKKRMEFLAVEKNMSAEQKAAAESYLDGLSKQAEKINQLKSEQTDYNAELDKQKKALRDIGNLSEAKNSSEAYKNIKNAKNTQALQKERELEAKALLTSKGSNYKNGEFLAISQNELFKGQQLDTSKYQQSTQYLDALIDRMVKLEGATQQLAHAKANFESFVNVDTGEAESAVQGLELSLTTLKTSFSQKGMDTSAIDSLIEKFNKIKEQGQTGQAGAFDEIIAELDRLENVAYGGAASAMDYLSEKLAMPRDKLQALAKQADLTEDQINALALAIKKFSNDSSQSLKISPLQEGLNTVVRSISAASASFSSFSNLMSNWDDSSITAKFTNIASGATNLISALTTGDPFVIAASVFGTAAGFLVGQMERAKKLAQELEQERTERLNESIGNSQESNSALQNLISQFNDLYNIKNRTSDEDARLASLASQLANEYNITGVAVQNLTGDYKELIQKLQQISSGNFGNGENVFLTAEENYRTAKERLASNSALHVGSAGTSGDAGTYFATGKQKKNFLTSQGYQDVAKMAAKGYGGIALDSEHLNDYGTPYGITRSSGAKSIMVDAYNLNGSKSDTVFKGQNGYDLSSKLTYSDLISQMGMEDIFFSESKGNKDLDLLISDYDSADYRYSVYKDLIKLRDEMDTLGISAEDNFYQQISGVIDKLSEEMTAYEEALKVFGEAKITEESNRYIGKQAGENGYDFNAFWNDYVTTLNDFEDHLRATNPGLSEEEIKQMAMDSTQSVLGMNSGLTAYSSALQSAYEVYGDLNSASQALIDLESKGFNLEDVDYGIIQAYSQNNGDYIKAMLNNKQQRQIYNNAVDTYNGAQKAASLLKEDMSFEEMGKLYDAIDWGSGDIIAWNDFYEMSYEDKQNYLQSLSDDYLKTSEEAAINARKAAEAEKTAAEQARDTFTGLGEEQYDHSAIVAAAEADRSNDQKYASYLSKWVKNDKGQWETKQGITFTYDDLEINKEYEQWLQQEGNKSKDLTDFIMEKQSQGANGISQAVIDEYNRLVAEAENAGTAIDDAMRNEMLWKAMGSQVDSVTTKVQRLANAITELPTDSKELKKVAEALGWSMDELVNSTEAERAAQAVAVTEMPTLKQSGTRMRPQIVLDDDGQLVQQRPGSVEEHYSTDQDYAEYAQELAAVQDINAQNANYQEQAITNNAGTIQLLSDLKEMESILSDIDIEELPQEGSKAFELLDKALGQVNMDMTKFKTLSKADQLSKIAEAQNSIIDKRMDLNEQLQYHYKEISEDTTGKYSEEVKLEAAQKYYDTVSEYNDMELQKEQNIANARQQALDIYKNEMDAIKARQSTQQKDAEKFSDAANVMSSAITTGELSFSDQQILAQAEYLDAWNNTTNAIQRAALANKAFSEYAGKNAVAGQQMAAVYKNAEKTLDGLSKKSWLWKDDQSLLSGWTGNQYKMQTKEDFIGMLSDLFEIDDNKILGAVDEAWDTLKSNGFDFEKATNAEITQAIMDQLNEMGVDADNAWKQILASAKDAMKNIGSQLAQEHIDAAQDAVDAWVDAFNKIADARQTLLEGGSLLKNIAGSPETILQYAKSAGMSPSEAAAAIMGGTLTADKLSFQNYNDYISQSMAKYGLDQISAFGDYKFGTLSKDMDWDALGYSTSDTRTNKETQEKEYKNYKTGDYVSESVIQGQLKSYYAAILKTTGLTEEEAELKAQQIIDGKLGYDTLSDATKKLIEAIYGSADAQKQYQEQIEAETQIQKDADTNNWYSKKENGYEAKYSDLQKLQQAIENAQEAKNNDKSWDTLDKSDRDILEKYGIDFSNVDSAAISCANALLACAEAALALAKANANNQGFYENKYGEYQKAVSRDEYIGFFTSDDDKKAAGERWDQWSKAQGAEYTSDGKLFIGEANSNITDSIAQIQETVDNLSSSAEKTSTNNLTKMAESVSMTKDEFIQYTEAMKEAGEITAKTTEGQYKQAQSLARVQKGLKSIRDNSKEWSNALKKNAGDVVKCNKTLSEMRSAFEEVLDVPVGSLNTLSEEFMTSAETAKLLEAAMDGDVDAYNKLQAEVAKQLLIGKGATISPELENAINTIATEMDNLPVEEPIEFGQNAQISPQLYNALNGYVAAIAAAGGDVQAAAAALGFDIEYEEKDVPMDLPGVKYTAGASVYDPATKTTYTNITPHENNGKTTWKGLAIKTITNKGTRGGNIGGHKAPSSGGGGGGGGKAKKIDKKDPEDEKERYHHVNKVLERLSNQFDEIDKKKSRVYGKSYLDYISQEIALTEKQCDAYQRYIDEAKEYLALDTQRVASLGATFDEFGNIENYDQVMDNIIGKYNEFVDRYNAMSASEQEAAEEEKTKWDEWYEEKKKWIENYEETVSTIYEQQNNLLEAQNKISEKTLEGIQYKVEIHVDMTEAEKDFLDYLNDTYDELLEKQGDVMNNLVRETELATSNLDALGRSKEELDAAFASGKLNQADYVEGLKDVNEQILDNLSNIQDLKKEIEELYGDTLEMASDAFDEQTEKVKNASEAMSSYISILGLIGKGSNLKDLTKFYDSQYEYNLQSLEMQKEYLDILRSEEQYYLERMNSAEGLTETERQQYEDLEKTIADVNSNILSDTESTLNQIAEAFNNEIEIIFKDLEERIAGVGNSVQDLADAYSYYQEEQSRYVTSARELYEVNKLNRQIEKTMNETSSKVNKNLLAALQDRINKQSELNELTEYDIEMNQLQYELLLKKIALEEAQNAKSTVRLTRDSGGNYVYQYTADQDDIMTKQQEYEDVLQKINDLAVNRVQDLESQLLEIYQNTLSKIKEIAQDQTLTEEEKYDKIQTIMNQFKEQTNFIQEQYQIASDNLITSNLAISEHYGQKLVEHSENAKNGLNQTIAAMIEDTEGLQQALENACANQIPAAMDTMQSRIDAVTAAVNLDYNSMSDSVTNYNKVTKDAQDQTSKTANSLSKDLLPAIHSATTAWDTYMGKLKNVISTYESMYQSILKTIQAQAKLSNATAPSTVKSSGTGKFSDTTTPSAGGKIDTSSGGGGSGNGGSRGGVIGAQFVAGGSASAEANKRTATTIQYNGETYVKANQGQSYTTGYGKWFARSRARTIDGGRTLYWPSGSTYYTKKYLEGGLADFTGPAWLDGSKSRPEMVLNAKDTENILTAVQGVRALDASTLSMLNKYITNASLAMSFGLGNISAGSVYGTTDTIQQEVHITAEFPNATNSAEIQDAFDNIINRATQYITTKR